MAKAEIQFGELGGGGSSVWIAGETYSSTGLKFSWNTIPESFVLQCTYKGSYLEMLYVDVANQTFVGMHNNAAVTTPTALSILGTVSLTSSGFSVVGSYAYTNGYVLTSTSKI